MHTQQVHVVREPHSSQEYVVSVLPGTVDAPSALCATCPGGIPSCPDGFPGDEFRSEHETPLCDLTACCYEYIGSHDACAPTLPVM